MTADTKRTILLTNDDGIYAEGLHAAYHAIASRYNVVVVAPDRERSAVGHGITLHDPLRATRVAINGAIEGWAVSGTPADCIKLAVVELLDTAPDLVISGINPGANVGVNLNYSGTVAAAKEAALYGLRAMAVSVEVVDTPDYRVAARFIAKAASLVDGNGLPPGVFLNVNVPAVSPDQNTTICITRQAKALYEEYFDKRRDPRNRYYYWQGSESLPHHQNGDSDGSALNQRCISITPVQCDMTAHTAIGALQQWTHDHDMTRIAPDESDESDRMEDGR